MEGYFEEKKETNNNNKKPQINKNFTDKEICSFVILKA